MVWQFPYIYIYILYNRGIPDTLQQISSTIQAQGKDNRALRTSSGKIFENLGIATNNLVEKSSVPVELSTGSNVNRVFDPVKFTGEERSLWSTWEIQARGKAKSCGPDPEVQFYAIFNDLKGNAARNVTHWINTNLSNGTAIYEGLLEELGRLYIDQA